MARAEWGLWSDEVDDALLYLLATGYMRRKRWEVQMLAGMLGGGGGYRPSNVSASGRPYREVGLEQLIGMMGARWA